MNLTKPYWIRLAGMAAIGVGLGFGAVGAWAAEGAKHSHADSRSTFVHRINIYDESGKAIVPPKPAAPGVKVAAKEPPKPYAPAQTCGKCHDYDVIAKGWHTNAAEGGDPGRPGEPWVYTDATTRTQIPLSYRNWPGTYKPADLGISDWRFVMTFGRHLPGGGMGEIVSSTKDADNRWHITGKLDIDCMICHSADTTHDPDARAKQLSYENIRWAPTVAMGLGHVKGFAKALPHNWDAAEAAKEDTEFDPAPPLSYDLNRFEGGDHVFFPVVRKPSASRCYYCHSAQPAVDRSQLWHSDRDVHIQSGLSCADCHRSGMDHAIARGYETEGKERKDEQVSSVSCRGCHMGVEGASSPTLAMGGRLGAPKPKHMGLPAIHLEKLSCTACHSGAWPSDKPELIQTSLAHALGVSNQIREKDSPPAIVQSVFLRGADGKIAPHRMVWPNFWGRIQDNKVTPLAPAAVKAAAKGALPAAKDGTPDAAKPLSDEQITQALTALAGVKDAAPPVYISGGKLWKLDNGKLAGSEHAAAQPYAWPLAHDVRPAPQALGARGCSDCHSTDSPIYFGTVAAQGPVAPEKAASKAMYELRGDSGVKASMFALSFTFRPMLKIISFGCAAVIGAVVLAHGLRGLGQLTGRSRNEE